MELVKRFCYIIFLLLIVSNAIATNVDVLRDAALKVVSDFCQFEFSYNYDARHALMKMSSEYKAKADKLDAFPGDLQIDHAYEVYAIKAYKILDLTMSGNNAIAMVNYNVLAKRTDWMLHKYKDGVSWGEAIFVEYLKPNYIEKIHLTYDGKRWWVLDPPSPKISVEKIIAFLEDDMKVLEKHNPKIKIGQALPGPQDGYNEDQRNLTLLKKLARE